MSYCVCRHAAQLHTPTGRMDDTTERGHGPCTAGVWGRPCPCSNYQERKQ